MKFEHPYDLQHRPPLPISSANGWPERNAARIVVLLLLLFFITILSNVWWEIRCRAEVHAWKKQAIAEIGFPATADQIDQWITNENAHNWIAKINRAAGNLTAEGVQVAERVYSHGGWLHAPAVGTLRFVPEEDFQDSLYPAENIVVELDRSLPPPLRSMQAPRWQQQLLLIPLGLLCGFGIWIFVRAERAKWRLNRGLCPTCAYPLGESQVCSECGAALPPRKKLPGAAIEATNARRTRGSPSTREGDAI